MGRGKLQEGHIQVNLQGRVLKAAKEVGKIRVNWEGAACSSSDDRGGLAPLSPHLKTSG